MGATLAAPERANLMAVLLHRLVDRSSRRLADGVYRVKAGGMVARLFGGEPARVESGDGPADCSMEGSLDAFLKLALGAGPVRAWLGGRVSLRGNPLKAFALLKVIRCSR